MVQHTELWNIRIKEGHWVGRADLFVDRSGNVKGSMVFPTAPCEDPITGRVSGSTITLQRHLTVGPAAGKIQTWSGHYNANGSAAQGTATNGGGPYHWSATIVVQ